MLLAFGMVNLLLVVGGANCLKTVSGCNEEVSEGRQKNVNYWSFLKSGNRSFVQLTGNFGLRYFGLRYSWRIELAHCRLTNRGGWQRFTICEFGRSFCGLVFET